MRASPVPRLSPLEVAAGFPIGAAAPTPSTEVPAGGPVAALEDAMLPALQRGPCVVSFSGGRDSSAILALATRLARREGLAVPVPVTLRFPEAPAADESAWQEQVVRHLGLIEWERVEVTDELDLVGPVAGVVLRRHGLLWPPNTHFHQPILDRARGGAVLTGIDGDGLFASWRWARPARIVRGRLRPQSSDLPRMLLASAPTTLRGAVERRRPPIALRWLSARGQADLDEVRAEERASEPARWDRWIDWYARRRSLRMVIEGLRLLAGDVDVLPVHPFADPRFLGTLARDRRWGGIGDRTRAMELLCGDLLPQEVVQRGSKAGLDVPFWNRHSRAFARAWDGDGAGELVDARALRDEWRSATPHACASTLLQAQWLDARPSR